MTGLSLNKSIRDARSYGRAISAARLRNIWLNYNSYREFKRTGNSFHPGLPISISIEPTTSCNLRCPHCPSGLRSFSRPTGMLDPNLNAQIVDELGPTLSYITYYFQGEPLLHPEFTSMVNYASTKRIYTASSTNAHHLSESRCTDLIKSGLSKLIVSIDGTTQESYSKYRIGGQLEKVLEGTKTLVETRRRLHSNTPLLVWQFIVFRHNENELTEIKRLASQVGVDELQIKTAQLYNVEAHLDMIPSDPELSRYDVRNGQPKFNPEDLNSCRRMWQGCVITWDGDVVPCCFDKDADHIMGNIGKESFRELWNGPKYRQFRSTLRSGRQNIDICMNCSEGVKVFN